MCDDPVPGEIPGDPGRVGDFGRAFLETAEALRDAARDLRAVANDSITISLAIDEVREKAGGVSGDVDRVAVRYDGAGNAFNGYASSLADAQALGNGSRSAIIENNADARHWRHEAIRLRQAVMMGASDPEVLADLQEATRRAMYYDGQYATHLGRYGAASENFEAAVETAIRALATAMETAGINDQWYEGWLGDLQLFWETLSKYLGPALEVIREALVFLKQIVDVLALIVTVLALFIPALAPLAAGLSALAFFMSVAIFALSAVLFLMGRETLGRVLSDGFSVVTSVLTSKLGGAGGSVVADKANKIANMGSGFAEFGLKSRNVLLDMGRAGAIEFSETASQYAAKEGLDMLVGGLVSANSAPISFALNEMDFQIGTSTPWGGDAAPDITGLLVGLADLPTLGVAGTLEPLATAGDPATYSDIVSSWNETFDTWGSIGAVPSR